MPTLPSEFIATLSVLLVLNKILFAPTVPNRKFPGPSNSNPKSEDEENMDEFPPAILEDAYN